jgi:hypothetical protein
LLSNSYLFLVLVVKSQHFLDVSAVVRFTFYKWLSETISQRTSRRSSETRMPHTDG